MTRDERHCQGERRGGKIDSYIEATQDCQCRKGIGRVARHQSDRVWTGTDGPGKPGAARAECSRRGDATRYPTVAVAIDALQSFW